MKLNADPEWLRKKAEAEDGCFVSAGSMTNREIDGLVESHVMGLKWDESRCRVCGWPLSDRPTGCRPGDCSLRPVPSSWVGEPAHYTTDIASAWTVVEKIAVGTTNVRLDTSYVTLGHRRCFVQISDEYEPGKVIAAADADTMPRAICLAALRAVGVEVEA